MGSAASARTPRATPDNSPRPAHALYVVLGAVLLLAIVSCGAAIVLTLADKTQGHPTDIARQFMDTFKMCVAVLVGVLAGSRFR